MSTPIRPFALLVLISALAAQAPLPPTPRFDLASPFRGVWLDAERGDGKLAAVGETYRASFSDAGAVYLPVFGSKAPRNWPFAVRTKSVHAGRTLLAELAPVAPQRTSPERVSFANGAVTEHWDLRPRGMEQSFVIAERFAAGELVVRLEVRTELRYAGHEPGQGLLFTSEGWGTLTYGEATAIDAVGNRSPVAVAYAQGELELRVPAGFAEAATYPLTIDPLVSSLSVDVGALDQGTPDVAYDSTTQTWTVVCTEKASIINTDVKVRRFDQNGVLIDSTYVESGILDGVAPHVANNATGNQFLIVWIEQNDTLATHRLVARRRSAASGAYFTEQQIDSGTSPLPRPKECVVGGSNVANNDQYMVAWINNTNALTVDTIKAAPFSTTGVLGNIRTLDTLTCASGIAINRSNNLAAAWLVAYANKGALSVACVVGDIRYAVIGPDSSILQQNTLLEGQVGDDDDPGVAGDGTTFVVVWEQKQGVSDFDIAAAIVRKNAQSQYLKVGATQNFTAQEPGAIASRDQRAPRIDFNGVRYTEVSMEVGTLVLPFATTFGLVGSTFVFHEGHVALTTVQNCSLPAIASEGGSGGLPLSALAVWQQIGNGTDIRGAFYDARKASGGVTKLAATCQRLLPLAIAVQGTPVPGFPLQITLSGVVGTPFLVVGAPAAAPLPLCTNSAGTCRLLVEQTVVLQTASLSLAVPRLVELVGAPVGFQGIDVGSATGCPSSLFGFPFATSDAAIVTLQ